MEHLIVRPEAGVESHLIRNGLTCFFPMPRLSDLRLTPCHIMDRQGMDIEGAEKWIVDLIRSSQLDAKIDSRDNNVIMGGTFPSVYQQVGGWVPACLPGCLWCLFGAIAGLRISLGWIDHHPLIFSRRLASRGWICTGAPPFCLRVFHSSSVTGRLCA